MLEIDKDIALLTPDPCGPLLNIAAAVVGLSQPHVHEGSGDLLNRRQLVRFDNSQRGSMLAEKIKNAWFKP